MLFEKCVILMRNKISRIKLISLFFVNQYSLQCDNVIYRYCKANLSILLSLLPS